MAKLFLKQYVHEVECRGVIGYSRYVYAIVIFSQSVAINQLVLLFYVYF